jgi:hypothetical protein
MSKQFEQFCLEHGIKCQHTLKIVLNKWVSEHTMHILHEGVTTLLKESKLPDSFWAECLGAFIYVLNRTPASAVPMPLLMNSGLELNLMSLVFESGDALLDPTWRSVSSLATLMGTRVGNSTILPPRRSSSASMPVSLMSAIFLVSRLHPLHLLLLSSFLLMRNMRIWGSIGRLKHSHNKTHISLNMMACKSNLLLRFLTLQSVLHLWTASIEQDQQPALPRPPTPPLAVSRRPHRDVRPPGNWWEVPKPVAGPPVEGNRGYGGRL